MQAWDSAPICAQAFSLDVSSTPALRQNRGYEWVANILDPRLPIATILRGGLRGEGLLVRFGILGWCIILHVLRSLLAREIFNIAYC